MHDCAVLETRDQMRRILVHMRDEAKHEHHAYLVTRAGASRSYVLGARGYAT